MEIFKLFGSIMVDNDKANESLSKTDKQAEGVGKRFLNGAATVAKWGAAAGAAALTVGTAMFAMASKAGDAADRLLDLKAITGMSTDEIQRWEKVTKVAGVSADAMTNASQKLTKSLDTMINSGGKGAESLNALGLSVEEIANMNADQRMNAITKALADIEDPTMRAKLGTDLLGGSWKEIAPIVDMGAEAMQKAKDSANVISEDDLNKANNFRISVAELKDQFGHFFMMLSINVIPIMQTFMDWIMQHMPKFQEIMGVVFGFVGQVINQLIEMIKKFLIPVFQSMKDWVDQNLPQIQAFFETAFTYIQEVIETFVKIVLALWDFFGEYIINVVKMLFDTVKNIIESAFKIIRGVLDVFIGLFTGDWKRMGDGLKSIWEGLWKAIESILRGAWNLLSNAFNFVWGKISDWFSDLKNSALQWGKNMISGFIDGMLSMGPKIASAAEAVVKKAGEFLKFWSPAKKGEGRFIVHWGRNMIDGFLDGVEQMIPQAQLTMNSVVGAMKPSPDKFTPPSPGRSTNNQPIQHITYINVEGNLDSDLYDDIMEQQKDDYDTKLLVKGVKK